MSNDRKNSITYEQFGAVGDGICDDFAAIRAAHEFANERGLDVHATSGKTYYIHKTDGKCAEVQTNTYWNGAKFIFDDSGIKTHRPCGCPDCIERSTSIFHVKSSRDPADVADAVRKSLPILSAFDGVGTQRFVDWDLGYDALVHIKSNERKVFIRMGANADAGDSINEVLLVHKDGSIDPSTPVTWNYTDISSAIAYFAEEDPIVIDGGGAIIQTVANTPENNNYIAYARNIAVRRSNVRVCNFSHTVLEEQEFRAPYAGILRTERCNNVTYENIVLQAARRKFVAQNNQQGTYEIGGFASNDIKFINVNAKNFFATGAAYDYFSYGVPHVAGQVGNRGMMGSNYCRNFYFKDCRIVNFDSHKGMGNLTIENCELQGILVMGAGNILIKNTVLDVDTYKTALLYRNDYGASFRGNITLDSVDIRYSDSCGVSEENPISLIKLYYNPNNDYDKVLNKQTGEYEDGEGSTNYMATNVYVRNVRMTKHRVTGYIEENERGFNDITREPLPTDDKLYIFAKGVSNGFVGYDISKFTKDGGISDKNRHIPPETITIENSYENISLPTSLAFKNATRVVLNGQIIEL